MTTAQRAAKLRDMSAPAVTKWIYDFAEGSREMRELLGGKGSGIAEMARVLGKELVPAGFTITTEACVAHMRSDRTSPEGAQRRVPRRARAEHRKPALRLGFLPPPRADVRQRRLRRAGRALRG
jgi:hypothetical protein